MTPEQELGQLIDPQGKVKPGGAGVVVVRCPAHDDRNPSLSVWYDDKGKAAFNCHRGCDHKSILMAMPQAAREVAEATFKTAPVTVLVPSRKTADGSIRYPYHNLDGTLAYHIVRGPDKQFRLDPRGASPILYNLPQIAEALGDGEPVWVVEGEKDADTLTAYGLAATTAPFGAGKFDKVDSTLLAAAPEVYVIPDNDDPGRKHAEQVASLTGAKIVTLPGLPEKGDVSDWLEAGNTIDELRKLAGAKPEGAFRFSPGSVIFDMPLDPEPLWGDEQDVLWAKGEPIMVYGPTGIGKTTLTGRLLLSLIGADPPEVLGHPVTPLEDGKTLLYVAADRPRQAMRSLRRMVHPSKRDILAARLVIEHERQLWAGENDREMLWRACEQAHAGVVILDSTKDVAAGPLKDEGPAKALMDAIQVCIARGVDVLLLHHPRKGSQEGKKDGPRKLDIDDVYGSAWLTAGVGSVLCVDGVVGAGMFMVYQLKAPASFVEPMEVAVDYATGRLERRNVRDLVQWMKDHDHMALTARQAAAFLFATSTDAVNDAQRKKAKRKLDTLVKNGQAAMEKTNEGDTYIWTPEPTLVVPPAKTDLPVPF